MSPGHEPAAQPEIIASDVGAQEEGLERGCIAGEEGAWESDSATPCGQGFPCAGDVMHTHTHPCPALTAAHYTAKICRGQRPLAGAGQQMEYVWKRSSRCLRRRGTLLICWLLSAPSRHTPYLFLVVVCAVAAHALSSSLSAPSRHTPYLFVVVCAVAAHSLFDSCRRLRRRGTLFVVRLSSSYAPSRHKLFSGTFFSPSLPAGP